MSPKRPDRASSPRGRERARQIIVGLLEILYGRRSDLEELTGTAADLVVDAALARPDALRLLDRRREIDRGWFQRPRMVGYVCYADRFAGDLQGVLERLDYLAELGVTYLHVMPLLKPREGPDDGGYAVIYYRKIDPRLGSIDDLERLVDALHSRGMALCIDLVLNHTAAEHPWAQAALALDRTYRDFYRVFPGRTMPDRFERTVPEVFPDTSPGSFHQRRRARLGVDHLRELPVGPRLDQPAGVRGDAGRDALPRQQGRRRAAAGRGTVPVEARGLPTGGRHGVQTTS